MATKITPDGLLRANGEVEDFVTGEPLPNFTGTVYAYLNGRSMVLYKHPAYNDEGHCRWSLINFGCIVETSALDKFLKEEIRSS